MKLTIRRLKLDDLIIGVTIVFYMLSALNKSLTYIGLMFAIIGFFLLSLKYVPSKSVFLPKLIVALLLFQNFCIGIGGHLGSNMDDSLKLLTQIPTILVMIVSLHIFLAQSLGKRWLFIIYALFVISYFFRGSGHMTTAVVYLRNFLVFFLALLIGRNNLDTTQKKEEFFRYFIMLALLAGVFGIIGIIGGNEFFNAIGVRNVYVGKGWKDLAQGATPGNFRTLVFGIKVNRMASLYYEPVNFSYFIFLATLIAYFTKRRMAFLFLLVCGVFTFGKGGILVFGLTVMGVSFHTILNFRFTKRNRFGIILLMLLVLVAIVVYISAFMKSDFGTYNHFYGFFSAIPELLKNPLGHGMGTAGNILRSYTASGTYTATESAIATMGYQLGIIGIAIFFALLYHSGTEAFRNSGFQIGTKHHTLCMAASYMPFILFLVSVFQENTLSPQVIVPFMLVVGSFGVVNVKEKTKEATSEMQYHLG